jgi:uncharacterized protein YoaH (UPF0181 family)
MPGRAKRSRTSFEAVRQQTLRAPRALERVAERLIADPRLGSPEAAEDEGDAEPCARALPALGPAEVDADPDPQQREQEDEERAERLREDGVSDGDARALLAPLLRRRRKLEVELVETAAG